MIIIDDLFDTVPEWRYDEIVRWWNLGSIHDNWDLAEALIDVAADYFNLESTIGYENWAHNRPYNYPSLHVDRDEKLFEEQGIQIEPLCSIIYYPFIKDLKGGKLISPKNWQVTPKQNRVVMFGPGVPHIVEDFTGGRISFMVNPWHVPVVQSAEDVNYSHKLEKNIP